VPPPSPPKANERPRGIGSVALDLFACSVEFSKIKITIIQEEGGECCCSLGLPRCSVSCVACYVLSCSQLPAVLSVLGCDNTRRPDDQMPSEIKLMLICIWSR
jgi:hypothetical protein